MDTKYEDLVCCNSGCNPCILDVYEAQLKHPKVAPTGNNCIFPLKYTKFKLITIIPNTHDSNIYIFQHNDLQEDAIVLYNPGQHFLIQATNNGQQFTRAYTPIPFEGLQKNQFAVVVKLYGCGEMSRMFKWMKLGTVSEWRGPYGDYQINSKHKHMLFIAQGSGIAPIFAIIKTVLDDEECMAVLKLFYCCRSCEDIILRDDLYKFSSNWNFSYEVFLTGLDKFKAKYNEVLHENRLGFSDLQGFLADKVDVKVLICGSEGFSEAIKQQVIDCNTSEDCIEVF